MATLCRTPQASAAPTVLLALRTTFITRLLERGIHLQSIAALIVSLTPMGMAQRTIYFRFATSPCVTLPDVRARFKVSDLSRGEPSSISRWDLRTSAT
jgi:hypothetical protein